MSTSSTHEYTVVGMSCQHCVVSVREEVWAVTGVDEVDIDLASGRLVVSGKAVGDDAIRRAVAEAGYQIVA